MKVDNINYEIIDTFDNIITIPDCFVSKNNKIGKGHGESKLYICSKQNMIDFFGGNDFSAKCLIKKQDLILYLNTLKKEYYHPSQNYYGKDLFVDLWEERMKDVESLDDIIYFNVSDQFQITGKRGYVNSDDKGYKIIRDISLPLVSYLSIMKLNNPKHGNIYYWKLFVDFEIIQNNKNISQVLNYGLKTKKEQQTKVFQVSNIRKGQDKFREKLLEECPFCPITMVNDERLLIASHIKPWAVANEKEKIDPKNGFMLSPLYDRLFDKGFITFTEDKKIIVSDWLSPKNIERLKLKNEEFIPRLPIDKDRINYLKYHREFIFKG